jgi:hypothetical protein
LRERRNDSLLHGIVFVAIQEPADAPHAVALLGARRERPRRRGTESSDEFAPSKANPHTTPPLPLGRSGQDSTAEATFRKPAGALFRAGLVRGALLGRLKRLRCLRHFFGHSRQKPAIHAAFFNMRIAQVEHISSAFFEERRR